MHTIAAVIEALERAPLIVVPLVREVSPSVLKRRPAAGRWSAHEHACHLALVHRLFFVRLDQILAQPRAVIAPYQPGESESDTHLLDMDLEESLTSYVANRQRLVARIRQLSEQEWRRTAEHGEYNHYSVFIMLRHAALHDFLHAYRIEELLLKRDWPEAGPL